jgi:hypothetical protein
MTATRGDVLRALAEAVDRLPATVRLTLSAGPFTGRSPYFSVHAHGGTPQQNVAALATIAHDLALTLVVPVTVDQWADADGDEVISISATTRWRGVRLELVAFPRADHRPDADVVEALVAPLRLALGPAAVTS